MTRAAESGSDTEWGPWQGWNPSNLSAHEGDCCRTARLWFLAMDRSLWRGEGGPTWITNRYPWGPGRWPLHWCEAVKAEELDCGAHQALTMEAFRARGVRVVPVQLIQIQEGHNLGHFQARWEDGGGSPAWVSSGSAYHEAVATIIQGTAEVWDGTVNAWLSPDHVRGVRGIAGIRIGGPDASGEVVCWRGLDVPLGEWVSPARLASMSGVTSSKP